MSLIVSLLFFKDDGFGTKTQYHIKQSKFVMLEAAVEGDPKPPFSFATTPRSR